MANSCRRFEGKVAVLTASTEGIGLAIARRLGLEGAKIVVSSRNIKNVENAVEILRMEGIDAIGVQCHVANKEERSNLIQEAIKHYGGIDILVSCAGVNPYLGYITECPEEAFHKMLEVNVKSSFLLTKEVIPFMKQRGGGSILYLSTSSVFKDAPTISAYATSKSTLTVLAKAFARAVIKDNIRVNCIAPGPTATNFLNKVKKTKHFQFYIDWEMPMKRLASVEEVAGPAAFLVSDDASYITGETLIVSGGAQSRL